MDFYTFIIALEYLAVKLKGKCEKEDIGEIVTALVDKIMNEIEKK